MYNLLGPTVRTVVRTVLFHYHARDAIKAFDLGHFIDLHCQRACPVDVKPFNRRGKGRKRASTSPINQSITNVDYRLVTSPYNMYMQNPYIHSMPVFP